MGDGSSEITRKKFLQASVLIGCIPAQALLSPRRASAKQAGILRLKNENNSLNIERDQGRVVGFRASDAPKQEFIKAADDDPAFVIQYLDNQNEFQQIDSRTSERVTIEEGGAGSGDHTVSINYRRVGRLDIDAEVHLSTRSGDPLTYWSISITNQSGIRITDVQFPIVVVQYDLKGSPGAETLVRPADEGRLMRAPRPEDLEPDHPLLWQLAPGSSGHYPGPLFAQFLAYHNDRAGIYLACQDVEGRVKLMRAVHHNRGIRLGIAHIGDWPERGSRKLEYDVVTRAFVGDWHEAAQIYRDWSLKQHWAAKPLHKRTDVPAWLLDSPPHIIVRIQGQLDAGPAEPNREFLPYPKTLPLLEDISKRINAPVLPVIMSWERPGPWIYPDSFPPAGGDESLRNFTKLARARGWHIGTFCNGTRWVTGQYWSRYDGRQYYRDQGGERTVCRTPKQEPWREAWDRGWRPSIPQCLGVRGTRDIADKFVQHLVDDGLDWVQFLDQNVNCQTFPCYSKDHGHAAIPGVWMTSRMRDLLDTFDAISATTRRKENREIVFSVERPPNEYFMSRFQICDLRVVPPGHSGPNGSDSRWSFIPLYNFLYHEFILLQGGFGSAPEPYHMQMRNAYNLVLGQIPGGVMTGSGRLLNKDTFNWAPWSPEVGNNEHSLEMLHTTTALRRSAGKPYLVFGRMLAPSVVEGIRTIEWERDGRSHAISAVFHSSWSSPEGQFGFVAANWTGEDQLITIRDSRLGPSVTSSVAGRTMTSSQVKLRDGQVNLVLPPLSCGLLESENRRA